MGFNLGDVWKNTTGRRGVVTTIQEDGQKGTLLFDDGEEISLRHAELTQLAGMWKLDVSPKPEKTAEELRSFVVTTASRHPVWPAGMDVVVRSLGGGKWAIDGVSPPNQNIAYADATKHAANIALAYGSLFSLKE